MHGGVVILRKRRNSYMSKILYNVTVKIDKEIHKEWLDWMLSKHIPDVMKTECFETFKVTKILGDDDEYGVSFAIQYIAPNMDTFQDYQLKHAPVLQQEHSDRYMNRYAAFRTMMEIVAEG
jgi:hypothetical protein